MVHSGSDGGTVDPLGVGTGSGALFNAEHQSLKQRRMCRKLDLAQQQLWHMTAKDSGAEEAKGEVYYGHEICMSKAAELLQACSLPLGLLPLDAVEKCSINRDTGFVWINSKKETKHYFNLAKRMTKYGTKITARASKGQRNVYVDGCSRDFFKCSS